MNPALRQQQKLLVLLTQNMKEMETELRAHSIVLEALTEGVIEPSQMGEALIWARESTAMLDFVNKKYLLVEKMCATAGPAQVKPATPFGLGKIDTLIH
jgi:hypothetical protein